MSDYYFEFRKAIKKQYSLPGEIIRVPQIDISDFAYKYMAQRVWVEVDNGNVLWIDKGTGSYQIGDPLTQEELEEFFWIKLRSFNV